jgi:hypothetical protein
MDLTTKVMVWNRAAGEVFYTIPDLRVRREWAKSGDSQPVSLEELSALKFAPGGTKLLEKYLLIKDQDACEFLELPTDPEYFYDENAIKVLLKEGSMDQLLDCLEFAPKGVIDLMKKIAIDTKLDSSEKRKAISEHLNINIDAMIRNNEDANTPDAEGAATEGRQRRSTPVAVAPATPTASKYNVVNRK